MIRARPAFLLVAFFTLAASLQDIWGQDRPEVPSLLREIRDEILGLPRYPGEGFARGEFFLGEGDDDTYKTHAVGILVNDEAEGTRMTIVVSRLEPARDDPRVKYAREPRTIACRLAGETVEVLRSDYGPPELEKLLPLVLKAVVDKKALLKK
jgi:hypothetical protein